MKQVKMAYFQLGLSMSFVGANVAVGKLIVEDVPIFLFSEIRFLIALLFLVPMLFVNRQQTFRLHHKQWGLLFLQSFFGVFLFSILILYGVKFTSATSAGIITSTVPAVIGLLSFFLLRDRLTFFQILSVCLAVLGISIITFKEANPDGTADFALLGNLLVLGSVVAESLFTILAKKLSGILTPIQMATGVNIFGFLLFLPFAIKDWFSFNLSLMDFTTWSLIVYYSITASVLSFVLWYRGVEKVRASVAGLFTGFMPVAAAIVGIFILKEPLGWTQVIGIICVILAIFLGTKKSVQPPLEKKVGGSMRNPK
ncbi:DMT family transporter [Paenactinomyces guangxiensis]|uniref:DMT family transporter n=1 Tax=Paenactinomyces guangxiensis TaxID=1490290 RepID=A0A7W1WRD5_9BACL|nr:DMT family transporter [Paenactinomyces guangxiensis]MBA4494678.1 DMT family transporter [Paenactinomyces guangxiensis]MBH8591762.1 DMT family transporter [Paenactinomyces guangxiensis]